MEQAFVRDQNRHTTSVTSLEEPSPVPSQSTDNGKEDVITANGANVEDDAEDTTRSAPVDVAKGTDPKGMDESNFSSLVTSFEEPARKNTKISSDEDSSSQTRSARLSLPFTEAKPSETANTTVETVSTLPEGAHEYEDPGEVLASIIEQATLRPPSPTPGPSQPTVPRVWYTRQENPQPSKFSKPLEHFCKHPWASLLKGKSTPSPSTNYDSNVPEAEFEKIPISGYSGLVDGLFPAQCDASLPRHEGTSILAAVGPRAIEAFRSNHDNTYLLERRQQGEPLPTMPLVELASEGESNKYVHGIMFDGATAPVLYRVKNFFGTSVKLETVHAEVALPDRLDLHTIQLDPYAINIMTGKRGIALTKIIVGDLIWVYSLAVTVAFAQSNMKLPQTVTEAIAYRKPNVWRVARYALVHRELSPTLGFITSIKRNPYTLQLCMQGHRQLVHASLSRLASTSDATTMRENSFIVAPFRERQLDYMVFACQWNGTSNELAAHTADIPYFPCQPPTPYDIRLTSREHQALVQNKLTNFDLFKKRPNEVCSFLTPLYSAACGTIAACIAETTDATVHPAIWSSPDLSSFPVLAIFRIPIRRKMGWAVGRPIQGAYETDLLHGQIIQIEAEDQHFDVTVRLNTPDGVRFRAYLLASRHRRIAVGTVLHTLDDRANPVLALLEHSCMANLRPNTVGWTAARVLLSGDIQVSGYAYPDEECITISVAGSQIQLNEDQVNAVNMYKKEYPIQVVDSAYGAGKSLCAAKMAEESAKQDQIILVSAVQNSALDVIGAKIAQLQSDHVRAVRYVSETLAHDAQHQSPLSLQSLMENFYITHGHLMDNELYRRFKRFSDDRTQLREFMFSSTQSAVVNQEHNKLLSLEDRTSWELKILTSKFLKMYKPNVYLCTVSTALNLTRKQGLWRRVGNSWHRILLDEASMLPEATLMTLISRFPNAHITLIGDSKQLPPYVGVQNIPLAVAVSSLSVLDLIRNFEWTPMCHLRTVYRPHVEMMRLKSELFYSGSLHCGAPVSLRQALLSRITMPNRRIPVALIDIPSSSVQSATGPHSNVVEAAAANVLVRFLLAKGFLSTQIMVICLYRDQKLLCEQVMRQTGVAVSTVDSAQGKECSVIIVCTTRTQAKLTTTNPFFSNARRLNVALSRARDGMFILGHLPCLKRAAVWSDVVRWCRNRNLITDLHFFDSSVQVPIQL